MAGEVKRLIDRIIEQRSHGNPTIAATTKTKLMLKGIKVDAYTYTCPDDPEVLRTLKHIANDMGVQF